jgi:predicted dehydrogenase
MADGVGWGVLGTANIAARAFLPALAAAGGRALVVGSREPDRAGNWAAEHGVRRAAGYQQVLADPEVAAVYIALPNDQHVEWAVAAVRAGKAVLCEKPLGLTGDQVGELIAAVGERALVWESFVFPFHPQTGVLLQAVAGGRIGTLREIHSEFHFRLGPASAGNIRLQAARGGGALYDVGCYPVRLARLLTGAEPVLAAGSAPVDPAYGVEPAMAAVLEFAGGPRLVMSAGMRRPHSTFTRVIGDDGELRLSNPFHPLPSDSMQLWSAGTLVQEWAPAPGAAFTHAIDHIHRVLAGQEEPRQLAGADALGQARAMDLVRTAVFGVSR